MRVFVSSPYSGLEEERQAVAEALADGFHVIGMEDFGSSGLPPLATCLEALKPCGACVLILGGRYGSRVPELDVSYTEAEYEYAQGTGIQVFAYVTEGFDEKVESADQTEDDKRRQRSFKSTAEGELTIDRPYFSTPEDLAAAARRDIDRWVNRKSRPRFGRSAPDVTRSLAYAAGRLASVEATLFPLPVVLLDAGAAQMEAYPPPTAGRVPRKIDEIHRELTHKGLQVLVFNDLPVRSNRGGSAFSQRLANVNASGALVVCIAKRQEDLEILEQFASAGSDRVLWLADWLTAPTGSFSPSYTVQFSGEKLTDCAVALEIERFIERRVSEFTFEQTIAFHA